jgi:hypothetical protein
MVRFPGNCPLDGCSSLGLLVVLHVAIGHQNCRIEVQKAFLGFLRHILTHLIYSEDFTLRIEDGFEVTVTKGAIDVVSLKRTLTKCDMLRRFRAFFVLLQCKMH